MVGAYRGAVELEQAATLEDAVDDDLGEIVVVKDVAPAARGLVGREDHGAPLNVPLIDDMEEDVRRVVTDREVADLVDDEDVGLHVADERFAQVALTAGAREVVDELGAVDEERVEAVLERAVRDGDREVRLAASGLAREDDRVALGDEVGREERADRGEPQRGLVLEAELLDGAKEGESRVAHGAREARAATMSDLLGEEGEEQLLVRPRLDFGAADEISPHAARVGEREALEQRVEVAHRRPPFCSARWARFEGARPRARGCAARGTSS